MLKVCLTGGPCAGKSSVMRYLVDALEGRGYYPFVVSETATDLILNGIKPDEKLGVEGFQNFVLDMQLAKEQLYNKLVNYYPEDKIVILYDRGLLDSCAYVDKQLFEGMLKERNLTIADVYDHYDAVIHMTTAADGAEEFYQWSNPNDLTGTCNNNARHETPEEAREKDSRVKNCYLELPMRVVDNSTDFKEKVNRVISRVFALLGEPVPKEIERKFLIKKPTETELEQLGCISTIEIIQTYLKSDDEDIERRVRQRGSKKSGYNFYYTEKEQVGHGERIEREKRISISEYVKYLVEADTRLHQIVKERSFFIFDNKHFELDKYPFDDEYAILEVELDSVDEPLQLPPFTVVKEVTDDVNYKNHTIAQTQTIRVSADKE